MNWIDEKELQNMVLEYARLSPNQKKAARQKAKRLLREVPARRRLGDGPTSPRGVFQTAIERSENLIAAFVYKENGGWVGDIVIKKPNGFLVQSGAAPLPTQEQAEDGLRDIVAFIKASSEHPDLEKYRQRGMAPEVSTLLRVAGPTSPAQFIYLRDEDLPRLAANFLNANGGAMISDERFFLERARDVVVKYASGDVTGETVLNPYHADDSRPLYAAAFLALNGIVNVTSPK